MYTYIADSSEWDEWNIFNEKSPLGNVFQTKEFAEALQKSGMKVSLILIRDEKRIVGGTFYYVPNTILFKRMFVMSGPILANKEDLTVFYLILEKLIEEAKKSSCFGIQLRTPFVSSREVLDKYAFTINEVAVSCSFKVKLDSEEEMWKRLRKESRRKRNFQRPIIKATQLGVKVREAETVEDIRKIYSIHLKRMTYIKGAVLLPFEYFKEIWEQLYPKKMAKFMIAELNGKPIGESVFLLFRDTIYYFNNASLEEYWKFYPNTILVWEMMKWGVKQGYKCMDLYGVPCTPDESHPEHGVYIFKGGFGGEFVQEMQYSDRIISPLKQVILEKIVMPYVFPIYKKIIRYKLVLS